ncbi:hypothetical protein I3843_11G198600 [Carya illinoinensis]|uniref:Uncharacterized protein n=1 Tax=Carya illinoinensis TaxID=32201 RepID=A0A922J1C4_CARIL|nr:hypothetical protein I3842_11G200700 [Carya illinoinensis]KAG7957898.1 hypothetical protein I3843_11G198600 [Carya illinoinensis]
MNSTICQYQCRAPAPPPSGYPLYGTPPPLATATVACSRKLSTNSGCSVRCCQYPPPPYLRLRALCHMTTIPLPLPPWLVFIFTLHDDRIFSCCVCSKRACAYILARTHFSEMKIVCNHR